jgi:hypothetical protein
MGSTRNGATYSEEQSIVQWSPSAYSTIRRYKGTRSNIDTLAATAQSLNLSYVVSPDDGPTATLEVEYTGSTAATNDPISTEWNVSTRAAQVPIEEHTNYASDIAALDRTELIAFRQMMNGSLDSEVDPTSLATITAVADLVECISKNLAGVTSYLRPEVVLNLQYRYQAASTARPDMGRVGQVYSKSALITALSIPSDIQSAMPAGQYLCEDVDWGASSDGSRVLTQSFRHAVAWDADLYTINT